MVEASTVLDEKMKNAWHEKLDKSPGRFDITDSNIEAEVSRRIYTEPEKITVNEIYEKYHGNGLSTGDTERYAKLLKAKAKTKMPPENKLAFKLLDRALTKKLFSDDDAENLLTYGNYSLMLGEFIENNPEENPIEYVEKILEPVETEWTGKLLDIFRIGTPSKDIAEEEKEAELKRLAEQKKFNELPPPEENEGRTFINEETGEEFKSDGIRWEKIK
jgi:hypothetical protein